MRLTPSDHRLIGSQYRFSRLVYFGQFAPVDTPSVANISLRLSAHSRLIGPPLPAQNCFQSFALRIAASKAPSALPVSS